MKQGQRTHTHTPLFHELVPVFAPQARQLLCPVPRLHELLAPSRLAVPSTEYLSGPRQLGLAVLPEKTGVKTGASTLEWKNELVKSFGSI